MAFSEKQKSQEENKKLQEQDALAMVEDAEKDPAVRARLAGSHRIGQMLKGYRSFKEVGHAFAKEKASGEVELADISAKKEKIQKAREHLSKRYEDFKNTNEKTDALLKPFEGEKRELLLEALDRDYNPVGYEKMHKKRSSKEQEREEQIAKVRSEFSAAVDRTAHHMDSASAAAYKKNAAASAYLFLKEEKVFQAEDELNGGEKQRADSKYAAVVGEQRLVEVLSNHPALTNSLIAVANETRLSEVQRLYGLRVVLDEFAHDPVAGPVIEKCLDGWQKAQQAGFDEEKREAQRTVRKAREAFKKAQELFGGERSLETDVSMRGA